MNWYRVEASVQAASADEAEAIVRRSLPPQREGALAPSHVSSVVEIRWYVATVARPSQEDWCTAVLAADPAEVRATLERDFAPEQIGEIEPL